MAKESEKAEIEEVREPEVAEFHETEKQPLPFGQRMKKYGKSFLALLALAAALAITLVIVFQRKEVPEIFYYADQDNRLYAGETGKPKKTCFLTDAFLAEGAGEAGEPGQYLVQLSKDGKKIYYPEEKRDDGSFSLFVKRYRDKKGEGELLAKEVISYETVKKDILIYLKKDGSLNVMKGEENQCLSFQADRFFTDRKGKYILWCEPDPEGTEKYRLFARNLKLKKEEKMLAEGIDRILYVSDDLDTVYYEKDSVLYRITERGKEEKIVGEFDSAYGYDEMDDSFYYLSGKYCDLFYFDGEKSTPLEERVHQVLTAGKGILMYAVRDGETKWYLARKTSVSRVDLDDSGDMGKFRFYTSGPAGIERTEWFETGKEETGKNIFLLVTGQDNGTLYRISCAEGSAGLAEKLDDGVCRLEAVAGGKAYYIKEDYYEGSSYLGNLYCDGECVEEDVAVGLCETAGPLVFVFRDWDAGEQKGNLVCIRNSRSRKTAKDVYEVVPVSEKTVVLKSGRNGETFTLSYSDGKKAKKIAENVMFFDGIQKSR